MAMTPTGEEVEMVKEEPLEESPIKEAPPYDQVEGDTTWFTDVSARDRGGKRVWQVAALNPRLQITLARVRTGKSSQHAELMAVLIVFKHAAERQDQTAYIYTDSWAMYKGLTTWFPRWKRDNFTLYKCPLWGQEL